MDRQQVLAVDVGGTRLRAALVDCSGTIRHRQSRLTPASDGAMAVVAAIAAACQEVMAESGMSSGLELGLCAPGPLDARRGLALATPTIRGFTDFPLRQALHDELGLPVTIENDGPCATLGEWRYGAGKGARDFCFVTVSTGIGGGIVAAGRLLRGKRGLAGHVGHIPIRARDGATCFCGQPGCWEAEASGTALQRRARAAGFSGLEDAFTRARASESLALAFAEEAAADLSLGLAAITHMLCPERIVIGGGVSSAFDLLGPLIRPRLAARLLPPFRDVDIVASALGDDAGLLGAALLAFEPALRAENDNL